MLSRDLKNVATKLIKKFGSIGSLITKGESNPITGEDAAPISLEEVEYFIEYYETSQLIENRIIAGDAKVIFVRVDEPHTDMIFQDVNLSKWAILSIKPIEAQDLKIVYECHIRK